MASHSHKCKVCNKRFESTKLFDICMCPECQLLFNDPKGFLKSKTQYKPVEEVLALPVHERWNYSKWWSLAERLKAKSIVDKQDRQQTYFD